MIARALMHEPRLLVLDEPTTGLDPQSRLFLWERIVESARAGSTLLLTTHDMLEADRLCDRIAIMDHGQVIALDTPAGLRRLLPRRLRPRAHAGDGAPTRRRSSPGRAGRRAR